MNRLLIILSAALATAACTSEQQNRIAHATQNWTGTDGVLEVYADDKLIYRFLAIDKLSSETGNFGTHRYGYGVLDVNMNNQVDETERKVYFEVGQATTSVFHASKS